MAIIKQASDYLEQLKEKFPQFTQYELLNIVNYGLRIFAWVNRLHADVHVINSHEKYMMFTGYLEKDALKIYKRFVNKWRMKERVLFYLRKEKWDGYYYIGLTQAKHEAILKLGKMKKFSRVFLTKVKKELFHDKSVKHIWRVSFPGDNGWKFYLENFETDKVQYIGPNKYEVYNKCFLGRSDNGHASFNNLEQESN